MGTLVNKSVVFGVKKSIRGLTEGNAPVMSLCLVRLLQRRYFIVNRDKECAQKKKKKKKTGLTLFEVTLSGGFSSF